MPTKVPVTNGTVGDTKPQKSVRKIKKIQKKDIKVLTNKEKGAKWSN